MSTPQPKPNLFIGSSREAMPYARAIHEQIGRKAQVTPWYGGAFGVNDYTMETLERQLDQSDFGVGNGLFSKVGKLLTYMCCAIL